MPSETAFATKPQIAQAMVARAIAAGVPFRWVAADSVYGVGALEMALRRAGKGYVLRVNSNSEFHSWGKVPCVGGCAEDIAAALDEADWRRLSAGEGTKGPRLHDWAYFELADLDRAEFGATPASPWTRGLLIRRAIADGALAYFTTWCPHGTSIETMVEIEGHRWSVEEDFETGKNEFGLDHNETRSWHGWHRHVSLSMLALAMMAAVRHRANLAGHRKTSATASVDLICWSVQEIRRLAMRLRARRVAPAHVIAWSCWRRAYQARARRAHLKKTQL